MRDFYNFRSLSHALFIIITEPPFRPFPSNILKKFLISYKFNRNEIQCIMRMEIVNIYEAFLDKKNFFFFFPKYTHTHTQHCDIASQ
jgi:hypothetical protein